MGPGPLVSSLFWYAFFMVTAALWVPNLQISYKKVAVTKEQSYPKKPYTNLVPMSNPGAEHQSGVCRRQHQIFFVLPIRFIS
uniref:Uncharacterized protein n=1 Tax=Caenorhabditis japonica TaxID=281687 RepID=A0A8R1IVI8_CAEJA